MSLKDTKMGERSSINQPSNSKPISTPSQTQKLEQAFDQILRNRMARDSTNIIEIADTNLQPGIK